MVTDTKSMEIHVKEADKMDVPSILAIINHEITHSTAVYDYSERTLKVQQEWFEKKKNEGMPVIVAERGGEVLGYGTYGIFRPWDAYRFSVEHSIYISKEFQGRGIGKLIMKELIRLAKEQGYHTMVAGLDADNKSSYGFHKRFGFVEVGTFKEVGYKFDQWLDLILMQLMLG